MSLGEFEYNIGMLMGGIGGFLRVAHPQYEGWFSHENLYVLLEPVCKDEPTAVERKDFFIGLADQFIQHADELKEIAGIDGVLEKWLTKIKQSYGWEHDYFIAQERLLAKVQEFTQPQIHNHTVH